MADLEKQRGRKLHKLAADLDTQLSSPILDGVLLKSQTISTAATDVPHGLGRAWTGWLVTRLRTSTNSVYEATTQTDDRSFVTLRATASVVADLWVF